jgi:hypothetical protein
LTLHDRQYRGDAIQHALDVHVDDSIPLLDLERVHRRNGHHARVVENRVHASELSPREVDERVDVRAIGDVERPELGDTAGRADLRDDFLQALRAPRAEDDLVAARGERAGRGFSDAAAGAGDQDDFRHGCSQTVSDCVGESLAGEADSGDT